MLKNPAAPKACLLAIFTLACYLPAIHGEWLFDDQSAISKNPLITQPGHLHEIWFSTEPIDYWPVSYTALWIQWRLWGEATTGYHLVNLALHVCVALLAWAVLARLRIPGAWTIALLFALHPVNVETAAWIFQQKSTLAAVGFFGSLWTWLKYDETGHRGWFAASLGLFVFSMLAKTSGVGLPLVLLCCAWWRRGRVSRADFLASLPFLAVAVVLGLVSVWFQANRAIAETVVREDGFLARLAGAGWALWFYLAKALWPTSLAFVYPKWQIDGTSFATHLPWMAWVSLTALCWRCRATWGRAALVGMAYFSLMLAPVLGFVNIGYMRYSLVADHWQYLAILAPLALVVGGAFHLAQHFPAAIARRVPQLAAVAVALCGVLAWRQAHLYRSEVALWTDTLAKNPGAWVAHNNLALALARQDKLVEAEENLREALRLEPGDPVIQSNLANVLCRGKRFAEATSLVLAALERRPEDATLHITLGAAYAGQYKDHEAIDALRKGLALRPQDGAAHQALGNVLLRQGDSHTAGEHFRRALAIDDRDVASHVGLAKALASQQRTSEAREELQAALNIDSQHPEAHLQLANLLAARGQSAEAIQLLQDAITQHPDCAELHGAMAERLMALGRHDEARQHIEQALTLDESVPEIHATAGDLLAAQGQAEEAIGRYRRAVELNPRLAEAHKSLGGLLASVGRGGEAIGHYRTALGLRPSWPAVSSHLAWLLVHKPAATPVERQEALQWALQACRETQMQHPVALDSLAAAYAALGRLDQAADAAHQARDRAAALNQHEFAREVQNRLDEYRSRSARLGNQ
jgi:tetratricopeptide (TPR) repeat protein